MTKKMSMFAPSQTVQKWVPKEIWMNQNDMWSKDLYDRQWLVSLAQSYLWPRVGMSMSEKFPSTTLDYVLRRCRELNMDFWLTNKSTLIMKNPKQVTDPEVVQFLEHFLQNVKR